MTILIPTVTIESPEQRGDGETFRVMTAIPDPIGGGMYRQRLVTEPRLSDWPLAAQATDQTVQAVQLALAQGAGFPIRDAVRMSNLLGWHDGRDAVLDPSVADTPLEITTGYQSCRLLPELVPVDSGEDRVWLDQTRPLYRVLNDVRHPPVRRRSDRSLAVVYAENDGTLDFESAASEMRVLLRRNAPEIEKLDMYAGDELVRAGASSDQVLPILQEIFLEHRAVLFLGHLAHGVGDGGPFGDWWLAQGLKLPVKQITRFLQAGTPRSASKTESPYAWHIPEVIFANCCFSAGFNRPGTEADCYPKLFMDAGVRAFVGTSMDVVLNSTQPQKALNQVARLSAEFFVRWAKQPRDVIDHLYKAKEACGFPLVSSLYQLYLSPQYTVSSEPENPVPQTPDAEPAGDEPVQSQWPLPEQDSPTSGTVVSSIENIGEGRLGDYQLGEEVWSNAYSRTFNAICIPTGDFCLLQIPTDRYQTGADARQRIDESIRVVRDADLQEHHLVPTRCEQLEWHAEGQSGDLNVLVYERPADEDTATWRRFTSLPTDPAAPDYFDRVLDLVLGLATLVHQLHEKGMLHGNLSPDSLALRETSQGRRLVLKDAWIQHLGYGRSTQARYASPEELDREESGPERLKTDCWSLGVILYEHVAREAFPFDDYHRADSALSARLREVARNIPSGTPQTLLRIVRDCLMPAPRLRPAARDVVRMLQFAHVGGGSYVGELAATLNELIQTGRRLFAVQTADLDDVEETVWAMAQARYVNRAPAEVAPIDARELTYRLLVAEEGVGLTDRASGERLWSWMSAEEVEAEYGDGSPDYVVAINSDYLLFEELPGHTVQRYGALPVILIRGSTWWDNGIVTSRRLRHLQRDSNDSPVMILVDQTPLVDPELRGLFQLLTYPPAPPATLVDTILQLPQDEGLPVAPVEFETALRLAEEFHPCSQRQLREALRMSACRYGVIDDRVLEIRDSERKQGFASFGTATYTPTAELPDASDIGLPRALESEVSRWVVGYRRFVAGMLHSIPHRILIDGAAGCGRTLLAQVLAQRISRPLIRVHADSCLRGELGESENALRYLLVSIAEVPGSVVLFDDVDHFFRNLDADQGSSGLTRTLQSMATIILRWLDDLPDGIVAIMTATDRYALPAEWQWRQQIRWTVPRPDHPTVRREIFRAIFRRSGIDGPAEDDELLDTLADATLQPGLLSPLARIPRLSAQGPTVRLETGADIEAWIRETVFLHESDQCEATSSAFWETAALARKETN